MYYGVVVDVVCWDDLCYVDDDEFFDWVDLVVCVVCVVLGEFVFCIGCFMFVEIEGD